MHKAHANVIARLEQDKFDLTESVERLEHLAQERADIAEQCQEELAMLKHEGIKVSYELAPEPTVSSYTQAVSQVKVIE